MTLIGQTLRRVEVTAGSPIDIVIDVAKGDPVSLLNVSESTGSRYILKGLSRSVTKHAVRDERGCYRSFTASRRTYRTVRGANSDNGPTRYSSKFSTNS
jgi:hypothetical protein